MKQKLQKHAHENASEKNGRKKSNFLKTLLNFLKIAFDFLKTLSKPSQNTLTNFSTSDHRDGDERGGE